MMENKEYVTKSTLIITVKTLSKYNDRNRQLLNKQSDSETEKQANIQAEKQKNKFTDRRTGRVTSGHTQTDKQKRKNEVLCSVVIEIK